MGRRRPFPGAIFYALFLGAFLGPWAAGYLIAFSLLGRSHGTAFAVGAVAGVLGVFLLTRRYDEDGVEPEWMREDGDGIVVLSARQRVGHLAVGCALIAFGCLLIALRYLIFDVLGLSSDAAVGLVLLVAGQVVAVLSLWVAFGVVLAGVIGRWRSD